MIVDHVHEMYCISAVLMVDYESYILLNLSLRPPNDFTTD